MTLLFILSGVKAGIIYLFMMIICYFIMRWIMRSEDHYNSYNWDNVLINIGCSLVWPLTFIGVTLYVLQKLWKHINRTDPPNWL